MRKFEPFLHLVLGIILIVLGIEIINFWGVYPMPTKLLGLIGFATLAFGGFKVIINTFIYLIAFYATRVIQKPNPLEDYTSVNLLHQFVSIIFIMAAIWLWLEINFIDNTLNGRELFLKSVGLGLLMGFGALIVLYTILPKTRSSDMKGLDLFFAIPISLLLLVPAISSTVNRITAWQAETTLSEFSIVNKSQSFSRRTQYYIFIQNNGEERLVVDYEIWQGMNKGDTIQLELKQGILGYYLIVQINGLPAIGCMDWFELLLPTNYCWFER